MMYWDPSSAGAHSDGSVCVMIYRDDKSHRVFIHDVVYMRVADNDEHIVLNSDAELKYIAPIAQMAITENII